MTTRLRIHPFLSLITVSLLVGVLAGDPHTAVESISTGMGTVFANLAIIIVCGSIIGTIMEKNGAISVIAEDIIRISKKPLLSLNLLGFLTAVPVMCSILAYVMFIPIAKEIGSRLKIPISAVATSLSLGTLASFNLIYPSPGMYSAVKEIGAFEPHIIIIGLIVALPTTFIGYLYADRVCRTGKPPLSATEKTKQVGRLQTYAPIAIPLLLISSNIFIPTPLFRFLGDPNVALLFGVVLAVIATRSSGCSDVKTSIDKAIRRGGVVLLDICGGGALGATLAGTGVGHEIVQLLIQANLPPIFIPCMAAIAIQSVQGSRVVTMLVVPGLIMPALTELGLPIEIVVMSMASGVFLVSHANDPYFWTMVEMAQIDPSTGYRCYTMGCVAMGAAAFAMTIMIDILMY